MRLGQAIKFPFRGTQVWPNLGCVALCMLIPVVGGLVAMGYLFGVKKKLIENLEADAQPFSFGRFTDYLMDGLWPFLASLVLSLIIMPLVFAAIILGVIAIVLSHDHPGWMAVLLVAAALIYLATIFIMGPLISPLILKAGLEGSFEAAFDWQYFKDFWKRVGWLCVKSHLQMVMVLIPAALVSFCLPYLGMFALITISRFVEAHWTTQLYLEYLNRGGKPLKIKPDLARPAFEVVPRGTLNAQ